MSHKSVTHHVYFCANCVQKSDTTLIWQPQFKERRYFSMQTAEDVVSSVLQPVDLLSVSSWTI